MDRCEDHDRFEQNVANLAASVARLETSIAWISSAGKWMLGAFGAVVLFVASAWMTNQYKANEVYASVKVQEAMIATLMERQK